MLVVVGCAWRLRARTRFYLVTTLGERIVADLRSDVFAHLTRCRPPSSTGARPARSCRGSPPTPRRSSPRSALGLDRAAQSRAVRRRRRDDGGDQPAAVGLGARRDSGDRAAAGCFRPRGAPALARSRRTRSPMPPAYAAEQIGAVRTLQAFTNERLARCALRRGGRARLPRRRGIDPRARGADRDRDLPGVRQRGGRAVGRRAGRAARRASRRPARPVRALCGVRGGRARRSSREVWGEVSQAAGAAERLIEMLAIEPAIKAPAQPRRAARARRAARSRSIRCTSPIRRGRTLRCSTACQLSRCSRARRSRSSARPAPARARSSICCCASTIRCPGAMTLRRRARSPMPIRANCAGASRWCRRTP